MISILSATIPCVAAISLCFVRHSKRQQLAKPVLVMASICSLACTLLAAIQRNPGTAQSWGTHYFLFDTTAELFSNLITIIFLGIAIYLRQKRQDGPSQLGYDQFAIRSLFFLALSLLAIFSNHLVATWVLLEAGTLIVAPLIWFNRGRIAFLASWKYLKFSVIGLGLNLVGLMCLARAMGGLHGDHEVTFFLDELQMRTSLGETIWWEIGLALMVLGLGTKLGLAPMYAWLPDAYDEAPPAVTTLLASIQFNCVLLFLFRQVGLFRSFDPTLVSFELIAMGLISIAISSLHIVTADNYKRLIAYASINHAGTIALGLGIGKNASYGVVLYVVSNALVKAVLFLTCGNIKDHFGTKRIASLQGLLRVMPFSGLAFMLGTFALLGFAPFGSFLGEIIILSNMAERKYLVLFLFICLMLTINLIATGRALFPMIWGDPSHEQTQIREPVSSIASCCIFIVLLVSLGIYTPEPITLLLREVAMTLDGK